MAVCTVAERKRMLLELLSDDKVRRIVLFGGPGIGKTWTAREISNRARKRGLIDVALWLFLNSKCDRDALHDNITYQLSLLSSTGGSEVEDDNEQLEKDENQGDSRHPISAALAGKKLLLVLDDERNKTDEQQIMSDLETLLNITPQNYKVLVTTRNTPSSDRSDDSEKLIEVKHLSKEESLSLLQERAWTRVSEDSAIAALAEPFVEKTNNVPAAIVLLAKAFSYFAQQVSGFQMLKRSLEEASDNEIYNITQLLRSGYDLLPNSILIDCCWGGSNFFHDCRPIHFNELIAYWMMEGYLGHINCMKKAYERGHHVLMELIDCQILKKTDADYVIIEKTTLNLDDVLMERAVINLDDCYRCGFGGTASLGLANVVGDGPDGKWEGLGRITQKDGVVKTLRRGKQGNKFSTLLLDGRAFSREFSCNFFQSNQELQVLVLFNPTLKTLPPSSSVMHNLCMLVLRGCHFIEKIDHALTFEKLTVLEISGPSSLTTIPDEFFKHIPHLQSLNLSFLQIDPLPSSLYELGELRWLILRECSCLKMLKSLKKFKNLVVLDVSGATSLDNLQDKNFLQNKELQMLNFSNTKIKSLPLVNSLRKLTHLLLSGCLELDRLRGINSVTSLQILDLSGASKFKEFHDQSLENMGNLKILDLSGSAVDNLPSNIGNPHHLYLKGCTRLKELSCIESLRDLKTLDLSKAQVKTLPSFSNLYNLRWLLLSCCSKLEKLPDVNALKNLEVLDLSGCSSLTELQPDSFEQMSRLWKLDLSGTRINCLPPLSNLSNLRHLLLKRCADLRGLPPLESLSNLEELNLCGISFLREAGADFLKTMSHLQILDLSETLLQQLPSMSNLKNLHQLYLSGCPGLKTVPGLEALTKLEVLDLSGTAVGHLPFLKNFSNLRQLLLGDYPGSEELLQLGSAPSAGANVEFPFGISELVHLEQLDLPNMKDTQGAGSSKTEEPNQYGWGISSLSAETVGDNNNRLVSLSSSKFIQHLKNNPSLWKTSFKQFHFSVHPTEELEKRKVVSFYRDDFIFRDIYFKARQFSDFKEQGSLEIRGFHHPPKGINDVISHVDCVFLIDNAFESWLSEIGTSNLEVLKGCWIERCRKMESVFHEEDVEEIAKLGGLEVLWVSNSVNLKCIYRGNWNSDTFKNLKRLYLDCCPMLATVFSSSQLPINLQVLQIKFCDKLVAVFEKASSEPELPKLDTLYLWELPELKSIGCALPSLQTLKVWQCPNLVEFNENVKLARSL